MSNYWKHIVFILWLAFNVTSTVSYAQSATDRNPINVLENELNRIELANYQLENFDKRTHQKLADFVDYLNLIHNTAYDQALRAQAQDLVAGLFIENAQIPLLETSYGTFQLLQVSDKSGFRLEKNQYKKTISFELLEQKSNNTSISITRKLQAKVILKKVTKKFGNKKLSSWKVFFGDMIVL
ncbi:MAG: hypothetical protein ACPGJS_01840 [Flammeovirgaceae bacterium]